jgi:hypothetical protein
MSLSLLQSNVLLKVEGKGMMRRALSVSVNSMRMRMLNLGVLFAVVAAIYAVLPATVGAYATLEGPPTYSSASGLPDGRVYEQASPVDKNGNQAGAGTSPYLVGANDHYGYATANGDAVLFEGTGPMGESTSGDDLDFVATKNESAAGWSTRALTPAPLPIESGVAPVLLYSQPQEIEPSADLSHAIVMAGDDRYASLLNEKCGNQVYLVGSDPFEAGTWLERPEVEGAVENCSAYKQSGAPAGGSPNFNITYLTFPGTLLPEDASRVPHTRNAKGGLEFVEAWGFYEYREGQLREAGVLPNGKLDEFGAVPAVSQRGRARFGNQVSENGQLAFFVSPDPMSCEKNNSPPYAGLDDCETNPPQLYVRVNGEKTLLVSKDTLLPDGERGLPAAAPNGPSAMPNPTIDEANLLKNAYVFASPDGAQAFFQSEDRLTSTAPEGPPGNTSAKTYDFDTETGTLTYLPNVEGQIVATDKDGSAFAFVRPESGGVLAELDLWSSDGGVVGGSVTPVTQLPGFPSSGGNAEVRIPPRYVSEARMSEDGSVLVFTTATTLSGAFNTGGFEQIYRYDVSTNSLGCVSCAPAGVTPNGDVSMSSLQPEETYESNAATIVGTVESRGISANGDRVFFDTPTPLVPQDTNTDAPEVEVSEAKFAKQGRDVYEWENGVVYLISGGKSPRDSYYLDSSENGDDVFFATAEGLVPGDTDGGYDVYDARVPQPGDNPPAAAVPCEGAVCQGPPRVATPLTPPASATFSGLGNQPAEPPAATTDTKKTTTKTVKCKRGYVKKQNRCVKSKPKKKTSTAKRAGDDRRAR